MESPCKGLKVIELASVLAGPSVGQFFAELGAEVLKVEQPATKGDVTRSWKLPSEAPENTTPAYFSAINWGKKSIVLNLTKLEDREFLYEKIAEADVLIASYKAGDAEKLGVDYHSLQQVNPRLVYGSISGYGPKDERAGYDAVIQAEAGLMYMNGEPDGPPTKMPVALVDVLAAHQLKQALLLALWQRDRTGKGAFVSVSLFDAAVSALSNQATNWLNAGHIPQRMGSGHPNIVPYGNLFQTKDGEWILLAVGTDKQFAKLCSAIGLPMEERFASNPQRVQHKASLLPLLQEAIQQFLATPLVEELQKAHVPVARVHNLQQVFELPEAKRILLHDAETALRGVRQFVAQTEAIEAISLSPPPVYGE